MWAIAQLRAVRRAAAREPPRANSIIVVDFRVQKWRESSTWPLPSETAVSLYKDSDSFSLMVRSAGNARVSRTMAARAALRRAASFETAGKSRPPQDEGVSAQSVKTIVSGL